jgi:hypothetical protein
MRNINRTRPPNTSEGTSRRGELRAAHRPSAQLISEAVIASYIHEISTRHRRPPRAGDPGHEKRAH